ncbi:MAG: phosphoesterase [Pyrinomonadaceae bacterium]|nr:phosphoesterase [Pyrinomonadaceae bacterium]
MKLRLLYHGHCFDGVASAAFFTRFYQTRIRPNAEVNYTGLLHRPGALFDEEMFDADENAIVDFKYSPSERLTWWFDHHQSAFLSAEDEAHFRSYTGDKKYLDTTRKSCTELIADIARTRFNFEDETLAPLVHWAHIIDGALYNSAAEAVELAQPALQLMQVIESVLDDSFVEKIIHLLTTNTLDAVATNHEVQERLQPILAEHRRTLDLIRRESRYARGVVFFDLISEKIEGFNKFIPYYLHPETTYSVALTRGAMRTKISVGSNPFSLRPRTHNIATICERYGGGGHAVVGAVSFGTDEIEKARAAAAEIVAELSAGIV